MKRFTHIIVIILLCVSQAYSGIHDIRFSSIGIDNGLSHATVNGICQDALGYIWIATPDGLDRYDGNRFETFITDSIDHNIKAVTSDPAGNIWAITARVLSCYSPISESFTKYSFPDKASLTTVFPIAREHIAVGTSAGLYIFDKSKREFLLAGNTGNDHLTAISSFNGNLVFGTYDGRVRQLDGRRIIDLANAGSEINVLLPDKGALLVATEGDGLSCYNPEYKTL